MKPESLGENALTLDFMAVNVHIVHGHQVDLENPAQDIFNPDSTPILYHAKDEFFFDHAEVDEAIARLIQRNLNQDRQAMNSLKKGASIATGLLTGDFEKESRRERELLRLIEAQIPSKLEWDIDGEHPIRVADFIQHQVPFEKTRNWLFDQMSLIVKPKTGGFISKISIKGRSVYDMH